MLPATLSATAYLRRDWIAALALALITFAAFSPAFDCEFVNLDDSAYVVHNRNVTDGLSMPGTTWAFTTFYVANWHPLTWLSLQLDASLWRKADGTPNPFGFHLANVLLHAANAALLFLALRSLTGTYWPSVATAAPLRRSSAPGRVRRLGYRAQGRPERFLRIAGPVGVCRLCPPAVGATLPCGGGLLRVELAGQADAGDAAVPVARARLVAVAGAAL